MTKQELDTKDNVIIILGATLIAILFVLLLQSAQHNKEQKALEQNKTIQIAYNLGIKDCENFTERAFRYSVENCLPITYYYQGNPIKFVSENCLK